MTRDISALQAVLAHAEGERDAALAELTQLADAHARLRSQQEQLQSYRRDYHARWTTQFRLSGGAEVVQHYQSFVDRLNHALDQLQLQMSHVDRQTAEAREQLMERETRVKAVQKLIERRTADGQRRQAVHEQKLSDELASRMAWQQANVAAA